MDAETLITLIALFLLTIPVTLIALTIAHFRTRTRLANAEQQIATLSRQLAKLDKKDKPDQPAAPADVVQPETSIMPPLPPKRAVSPPPINPRPPVQPIAPRPTPFADALARLAAWLQENWFYAVSALSLALAGIFLVQYGMENGLLPPSARIAATVIFGAALIGGGEWIRRRFGDDESVATAYLPSVFSGAGLVTLFGAVLAARLLYGLIGPEFGMIGMIAVAGLGLFLGWMHGPLMAAIGVIGAFAAPIVLGPSEANASPLYLYYAIIALLGLGIDTIRRWAWVSVLTLVLAYVTGWMLLLASGDPVVIAALTYFIALPMLAIIIPARSILRPDHAGQPVSLSFGSKLVPTLGQWGWPAFPTLIAFGPVLVSSIILFAVFQSKQETEIWLSVAGLSGLTLVLILWSRTAPALQDQPAIPALALLASVAFQGMSHAETVYRFARIRGEFGGVPLAATVLVALGLAITLTAAWRSMYGGRLRTLWAAAAAIYAPALAIMLELFWAPAKIIGSYPWALHAAGLAAVMVLLAERFARRDGDDRLRVAVFVMSALSSLAFAFFILFSTAALTAALAVTIVTAAALDRRFGLPQLGWFISVGVVVLGYRLVVDPGLDFGRNGPLGGMLLSYGGTLAALAFALWLLRERQRPLPRVMLESAVWTTGGMLLSLLLLRLLDTAAPMRAAQSHWAQGLIALIWIALALAQLYRAELGGRMRRIRLGLAALFALFAAAALLVPLVLANPALNGASYTEVLGPVFVNSLAPAYLLPGLALLGAAWQMRWLTRPLRLALAVTGGALGAIWLVLTIRHFWQGAEGMPLGHGFSDAELYTYTVALLLTGGGLFYQSLARRDALMRKAGLAVIGLAVAKVFLIDVSGLQGLARIFSLLLLGLSLAGLAWLNRWAQARYGKGIGG